MADNIAMRIDHVSKSFKLPHERMTSIKSAVVNFYRRTSFEKQQVLKDVSFQVKPGEFFGIVGRNGSGKSTLLKLLAGIYSPDSGAITVNGKLTPFIELGVGFNPELTGRENVFLNGALLGFNRKEMQTMYDDIVDFAELEKFMDQKLKNYSSGMQVRLAFSIAIRVQSDILLIDEVLAVGDAAFQRKCFEHFMLLKKQKQTVVLVTHDMGAVRQYCDRAIMIDMGKVVKQGSPEEVAQAYQKLFNDEMEAADAKPREKSKRGDTDRRWGEGGLLADKPKVIVTPDWITIHTSYQASAEIPAPILGFTIYSSTGHNIIEGNTLRKQLKTSDLRPGDSVSLEWRVPNIFANGTYDISVACCDKSTTRFYDWWNEAASFKVRKEGFTAGAVDPELSIINYEV
ncbi:MAG TPA: ABC transporter ATP-binding protein, partial [Ktedonobacteraceae bacterium]|nr:ABC transporter ATP-binding protein [Ktedonobacteraceae bacterium]